MLYWSTSCPTDSKNLSRHPTKLFCCHSNSSWVRGTGVLFLLAVFELLSASSRSEGAEARAVCWGWVSTEAPGTRGSHAVQGSARLLVGLLCAAKSASAQNEP